MKIEEVEKLRESEKQKTLRLPNTMTVTDDIDKRELYCLVWYITYLMAKNTGGQFLEQDDDLAWSIKNTNPFLKSISGNGIKSDPYIIKTEFGDGEFFDARALIKEERLKQIRKFFCFNNSYKFAMALAKHIGEAEQISGIAFVSKPFLHSVIGFEKDGKKYVLDLNYDLIISYNLYMKLFSFEVLAVNKGTTLNADYDEISSKVKNFSYTASDYGLAFAYEETMQKVKKELGIAGEDGAGVPPTGV